MMNSDKSTVRVVGFLFLVQFATGILINEVLLGPYTFTSDYMTSVATHSSEIIASMLLGFVNEVISIITAVLLFLIFRKRSEALALIFLLFSMLGFIAVTTDNMNIQTLLTLSKEYVKAVSGNASYFLALGTAASTARLWTHLMIMLIACLPFSVFYYLLFRYRYIPRFISVWGLISVACMLSSVLLEVFGKGSFMVLYLPLGLNQLVLAGWFMAKGFSEADVTGSVSIDS